MFDDVSFSYRVVQYDDGTLGLHEVYYRNGTPIYRSDVPAAKGEDANELIRTLSIMLNAARKATSTNDILDDTTQIWMGF